MSSRCLELNPCKMQKGEKIYFFNRSDMTKLLIESLHSIQYWIKTTNESRNLPSDVCMDLHRCYNADTDRKNNALEILTGDH